MKPVSIVVTLIATAVLSTAAAIAAAPAQTSGIYLSAADYTERRLSLEGDCTSAAHKLEQHNIVHKPYIEITHGTETRRYAKSELYGFRACDGREYRFVENREYEILESSPIAIYTIQVPAREAKDLARDRPTTRLYFFGAGPAGEVLPLTRNNLKRAFPDNHTFHDALDQMFHSDEELAQYDDFHKMFKINRLLIASTSTDR